jgi:hypothetical protein
MAQLIKPGDVKVITKDGQITVQLQIDLNINLNQTGSVTVSSDGQIKSNSKNEQVEEDTAWAIPDFGNTKKIKFGK